MEVRCYIDQLGGRIDRFTPIPRPPGRDGRDGRPGHVVRVPSVPGASEDTDMTDGPGAAPPAPGGGLAGAVVEVPVVREAPALREAPDVLVRVHAGLRHADHDRALLERVHLVQRFGFGFAPGAAQSGFQRPATGKDKTV